MDNEQQPPGQDGVYTERVQYMFHAPGIAAGHQDPYADGGGAALLPNENPGPHYAERTAQGIGTAASAGWGTFAPPPRLPPDRASLTRTR